MSYLPQTKWGNCANKECGATNTEVIKVGKLLYCTNCRRDQKTKIQVQKANIRNKVRSLGTNQREMGLESQASRQNIINDLDTVVSRIVRIMAANEFNYAKCYTCDFYAPWASFDAGHFVGRSHMELRFDFKRNIRNQCQSCNRLKKGNLEVYAQELEKEQKGLVEQLKEISAQPYNVSTDELKQMLFDLRQKLKPLEKKIKENAHK